MLNAGISLEELLGVPVDNLRKRRAGAVARFREKAARKFKGLMQAFNELDTNGDGVLSRSEMERALDRLRLREEIDVDEIFEELDLDGRQKLTVEDLTGLSSSARASSGDTVMGVKRRGEKVKGDRRLAEQFRKRVIKMHGSLVKAFKVMDLNNSSHIEFAELEIALLRLGFEGGREARALFEEIDEDDSGKISLDELLGVPVDNLKKRRAGAVAKFREKAARKFDGLRAAFKELDTNNDGVLSRGEMDRAIDRLRLRDEVDVEEIFEELDLDGRQKLTVADLLGGRQQSFATSRGDSDFDLDSDQESDRGLNRHGFSSQRIGGSVGLREAPFEKQIGRDGFGRQPTESKISAGDGKKKKQGGASRLVSSFRRLAAKKWGSVVGAFEKMDLSKNKKLTVEELSVALVRLGVDIEARALFEELDHNGDGVVTLHELMGASYETLKGRKAGAVLHFREKAERRFGSLRQALNELDTNGDGELSRREMERALDRLELRDDVSVEEIFQELDLDGSNRLSLLELTGEDFEGDAAKASGNFRVFRDPAWKDSAQGTQRKRDRRGEQLVEAFRDEVIRRWGSLPAAFRRLDRNDNAFLEWREIDSALRKLDVSGVDSRELFEALDVNDNGGISVEELMGVHPDVLTKKRTGAVMKFREAATERFGTLRLALKELDTNGDGVLSRVEVERAVKSLNLQHDIDAEEIFDELDLSTKGKIRLKDLTGEDREGALMDEVRLSARPHQASSSNAGHAARNVSPQVARFRKKAIARWSSLPAAFQKLDLNNDKQLDRAELKIALMRLELETLDEDALFAELDVDRTGTITMSELMGASPQRLRRVQPGAVRVFRKRAEDHWGSMRVAFREIDKNNSGHISRKELDAALDKMGLEGTVGSDELLEELDLNGSGKISLDELLSVVEDDDRVRDGKVKDERKKTEEKRKSGKQLRRFRARAIESWGSLPAAFGKMDLNENRKIDRWELEAAVERLGLRGAVDPEKLFDELDENGSGRVSLSELLGASADALKEGRGHAGAVQRFRRRALEHFSDLHSAFLEMDSNGNGYLDRREVDIAVRRLGLDREVDAESLFQELDLDNSNKIWVHELMGTRRRAEDDSSDEEGSVGRDKIGKRRRDISPAVLDFRQRAMERWGSLPEAFRKMDASGDGLLSRAELSTGLFRLNFDAAAVDRIFKELDVRGDEKIDVRELCGDAPKGSGGNDFVASSSRDKEKARAVQREFRFAAKKKFRSLRNALKELGLDSDGFIRAQDLHTILNRVGIESSHDAAEGKFEPLAKNSKGEASVSSLVGFNVSSETEKDTRALRAALLERFLSLSDAMTMLKRSLTERRGLLAAQKEEHNDAALRAFLLEAHVVPPDCDVGSLFAVPEGKGNPTLEEIGEALEYAGVEMAALLDRDAAEALAEARIRLCIRFPSDALVDRLVLMDVRAEDTRAQPASRVRQFLMDDLALAAEDADLVLEQMVAVASPQSASGAYQKREKMGGRMREDSGDSLEGEGSVAEGNGGGMSQGAALSWANTAALVQHAEARRQIAYEEKRRLVGTLIEKHGDIDGALRQCGVPLKDRLTFTEFSSVVAGKLRVPKSYVQPLFSGTLANIGGDCRGRVTLSDFHRFLEASDVSMDIHKLPPKTRELMVRATLQLLETHGTVGEVLKALQTDDKGRLPKPALLSLLTERAGLTEEVADGAFGWLLEEDGEMVASRDLSALLFLLSADAHGIKGRLPSRAGQRESPVLQLFRQRAKEKFGSLESAFQRLKQRPGAKSGGEESLGFEEFEDAMRTLDLQEIDSRALFDALDVDGSGTRDSLLALRGAILERFFSISEGLQCLQRQVHLKAKRARGVSFVQQDFPSSRLTDTQLRQALEDLGMKSLPSQDLSLLLEEQMGRAGEGEGYVEEKGRGRVQGEKKRSSRDIVARSVELLDLQAALNSVAPVLVKKLAKDAQELLAHLRKQITEAYRDEPLVDQLELLGLTAGCTKPQDAADFLPLLTGRFGLQEDTAKTLFLQAAKVITPVTVRKDDEYAEPYVTRGEFATLLQHSEAVATLREDEKETLLRHLHKHREEVDRETRKAAMPLDTRLTFREFSAFVITTLLLPESLQSLVRPLFSAVLKSADGRVSPDELFSFLNKDTVSLDLFALDPSTREKMKTASQQILAHFKSMDALLNDIHLQVDAEIPKQKLLHALYRLPMTVCDPELLRGAFHWIVGRTGGSVDLREFTALLHALTDHEYDIGLQTRAPRTPQMQKRKMSPEEGALLQNIRAHLLNKYGSLKTAFASLETGTIGGGGNDRMLAREEFIGRVTSLGVSYQKAARCFDVLDLDTDGKATINELHVLLTLTPDIHIVQRARALLLFDKGAFPTVKDAVDSAFFEAARDNRPAVDADEFVELMKVFRFTQEEARRLFSAADTDRDGAVTVEDIVAAVRCPISPRSAATAIQQSHLNGLEASVDVLRHRWGSVQKAFAALEEVNGTGVRGSAHRGEASGAAGGDLFKPAIWLLDERGFSRYAAGLEMKRSELRTLFASLDVFSDGMVNAEEAESLLQGVESQEMEALVRECELEGTRIGFGSGLPPGTFPVAVGRESPDGRRRFHQRVNSFDARVVLSLFHKIVSKHFPSVEIALSALGVPFDQRLSRPEFIAALKTSVVGTDPEFPFWRQEELFNALDRNQQGWVKLQELAVALRDEGGNAAALAAFPQGYGLVRDGRPLTIWSLVDWLRVRMRERYGSVATAFACIDTHNVGQVTMPQFRQAVEALGLMDDESDGLATRIAAVQVHASRRMHIPGAFVPNLSDQIFEAMDTRGVGLLTAEEMQAAMLVDLYSLELTGFIRSEFIQTHGTVQRACDHMAPYYWVAPHRKVTCGEFQKEILRVLPTRDGKAGSKEHDSRFFALMGHVASFLSAVDRDRDGYITPHEFRWALYQYAVETREYEEGFLSNVENLAFELRTRYNSLRDAIWTVDHIYVESPAPNATLGPSRQGSPKKARVLTPDEVRRRAKKIEEGDHSRSSSDEGEGKTRNKKKGGANSRREVGRGDLGILEITVNPETLLSPDEFTAALAALHMPPGLTRYIFRNMDTNHEGKVSLSELRSVLQRAAAGPRTPADPLDIPELLDVLKQTEDAAAKSAGDIGGPASASSKLDPQALMIELREFILSKYENIAACFVDLDMDSDRSLSFMEFDAALRRLGLPGSYSHPLFALLDKSNDGIVTISELWQGIRKASKEAAQALQKPILSRLSQSTLVVIQKLMSEYGSADKLFSLLDLNSSESISEDELQSGARRLWKAAEVEDRKGVVDILTPEVISSVFHEIDVSQDGRIERKELHEIFVEVNAFVEQEKERQRLLAEHKGFGDPSGRLAGMARADNAAMSFTSKLDGCLKPAACSCDSTPLFALRRRILIRNSDMRKPMEILQQFDDNQALPRREFLTLTGRLGGTHSLSYGCCEGPVVFVLLALLARLEKDYLQSHGVGGAGQGQGQAAVASTSPEPAVKVGDLTRCLLATDCELVSQMTDKLLLKGSRQIDFSRLWQMSGLTASAQVDRRGWIEICGAARLPTELVPVADGLFSLLLVESVVPLMNMRDGGRPPPSPPARISLDILERALSLSMRGQVLSLLWDVIDIGVLPTWTDQPGVDPMALRDQFAHPGELHQFMQKRMRLGSNPLRIISLFTLLRGTQAKPPAEVQEQLGKQNPPLYVTGRDLVDASDACFRYAAVLAFQVFFADGFFADQLYVATAEDLFRSLPSASAGALLNATGPSLNAPSLASLRRSLLGCASSRLGQAAANLCNPMYIAQQQEGGNSDGSVVVATADNCVHRLVEAVRELALKQQTAAGPSDALSGAAFGDSTVRLLSDNDFSRDEQPVDWLSVRDALSFCGQLTGRDVALARSLIRNAHVDVGELNSKNLHEALAESAAIGGGESQPWAVVQRSHLGAALARLHFEMDAGEVALLARYLDASNTGSIHLESLRGILEHVHGPVRDLEVPAANRTLAEATMAMSLQGGAALDAQAQAGISEAQLLGDSLHANARTGELPGHATAGLNALRDLCRMVRLRCPSLQSALLRFVFSANPQLKGAVSNVKFEDLKSALPEGIRLDAFKRALVELRVLPPARNAAAKAALGGVDGTEADGPISRLVARAIGFLLGVGPAEAQASVGVRGSPISPSGGSRRALNFSVFADCLNETYSDTLAPLRPLAEKLFDQSLPFKKVVASIDKHAFIKTVRVPLEQQTSTQAQTDGHPMMGGWSVLEVRALSPEGLQLLLQDVNMQMDVSICDGLISSLRSMSGHVETEPAPQQEGAPARSWISVEDFMAELRHLVAQVPLQRQMSDAIQRLFKALDRSENGAIEAEELKRGLMAFGQSVPDEEIVRIHAQADSNGDARIDAAEFQALMAPAVQTAMQQDDAFFSRLRNSFRRGDRNKDGKLTEQEAADALADLMGKPMAKEEVSALFRAADRDGNGTVDADEFCTFLSLSGIEGDILVRHQGSGASHGGQQRGPARRGMQGGSEVSQLCEIARQKIRYSRALSADALIPVILGIPSGFRRLEHVNPLLSTAAMDAEGFAGLGFDPSGLLVGDKGLQRSVATPGLQMELARAAWASMGPNSRDADAGGGCCGCRKGGKRDVDEPLAVSRGSVGGASKASCLVARVSVAACVPKCESGVEGQQLRVSLWNRRERKYMGNSCCFLASKYAQPVAHVAPDGSGVTGGVSGLDAEYWTFTAGSAESLFKAEAAAGTADPDVDICFELALLLRPPGAGPSVPPLLVSAGHALLPLQTALESARRAWETGAGGKGLLAKGGKGRRGSKGVLLEMQAGTPMSPTVYDAAWRSLATASGLPNTIVSELSALFAPPPETKEDIRAAKRREQEAAKAAKREQSLARQKARQEARAAKAKARAKAKAARRNQPGEGERGEVPAETDGEGEGGPEESVAAPVGGAAASRGLSLGPLPPALATPRGPRLFVETAILASLPAAVAAQTGALPPFISVPLSVLEALHVFRAELAEEIRLLQSRSMTAETDVETTAGTSRREEEERRRREEKERKAKAKAEAKAKAKAKAKTKPRGGLFGRKKNQNGAGVEGAEREQNGDATEREEDNDGNMTEAAVTDGEGMAQSQRVTSQTQHPTGNATAFAPPSGALSLQRSWDRAFASPPCVNICLVTFPRIIRSPALLQAFLIGWTHRLAALKTSQRTPETLKAIFKDIAARLWLFVSQSRVPAEVLLAEGGAVAGSCGDFSQDFLVFAQAGAGGPQTQLQLQGALGGKLAKAAVEAKGVGGRPPEGSVDLTAGSERELADWLRKAATEKHMTFRPLEVSEVTVDIMPLAIDLDRDG
uniref:EF-hand domain-containing protein n=1 Tax=Chromera velia CCMP2878 TaxID=1169474 RepID=A0A0G4HH90_9ALVE|eukprot:Cvel_6858.t1-p1 / transcript=Cvel_6858.t1 / gene=Cvel_6858 / organism=Chromera_velia_CCMP2878 / gene_product=Calmodulin-like protein 5, putative / transcript_product=Calmodulin-like protein 5, putative / location=Cvel_scaffold346:24387-50102(+) / protein_length=5319 / sequence_SO=supercontig / SO=protein_coding / is_pseudo=false